ncbi:MAG: thioredoxin family protein, partial [Chloroflexi bacterium]|nr:thioredoxin family protein [Chloroflexota bacterium]
NPDNNNRIGGMLYIPGRECKSCGPTEQLLQELSALSDRIELDVVDYYGSPEDAKALGVEKIPALVVNANGNDNARFYGMPSGFEFALLLDTIVAASSSGSTLRTETRRRLKALKEDVHLQVFVTPTCQFCPSVARLAHAMAMESSHIVADVVEIQEFPYLASAYSVRSVPKTVINDSAQFTGAVTEEVFLHRIMAAVGAEEPEEGTDDDQPSDQTTPIG